MRKWMKFKKPCTYRACTWPGIYLHNIPITYFKFPLVNS